MAFNYQIGELNLSSELEIPMLRHSLFEQTRLEDYYQTIHQGPTRDHRNT
jgi:hypothetical protein